MPLRATLVRWEDVPLDKVTDMVARKAVACGEHLLVQTYLKKGALVPVHAHAGEQLIYVLQGALAVTVDGETLTVRDGEVLRIAADAPHQAEALDDTFLLHVRTSSKFEVRSSNAGTN
jgi:quercetin dioxygenase-like cupin family protein